MFGRLRSLKNIAYGGLFPAVNNFDNISIVRDSETGAVVMDEAQKKLLTGWDRVYLMFTTDEYSQLSPEVVSTLQGGLMSFFVGGVIGGFVRSRNAFVEFVSTNDATKFETHLKAKEKLQSKIGISFGKGALEWGWRLTAFTSSYLLISYTIAAYRGKSGIMEHSVGGMITGAVYKANIGIRGIVVGGVVGLVLGTISGLSAWALLTVSGISMDEIKSTHYQVKQKRDKSWAEAVKREMESEKSSLEESYLNKHSDLNRMSPTFSESK